MICDGPHLSPCCRDGHDVGVTELQLRVPKNLVSPQARWYWATRALLVWFVVIAVEIVILLAPRDPSGIYSAVLAVTVCLAIAHLAVMPQWRYRVHRWEIGESAVYTQSGWFSQERRIAPLARIQTVDTQRGPVEQLFGLSNVTVTTASAKGPLKIHALDAPVADRLVERLTEQAQLDGGDGT